MQFKIEVCVLLEYLKEKLLCSSIPPEKKVVFVSMLPEGEPAALKDDWLYVCEEPEFPLWRAAAPEAMLLCIRSGAGENEPKYMQGIVDGLSLRRTLMLLQERVLEIKTWYSQMQEEIFSGCGIQRLLDISSAYLENHINITDSNLKLLAYTKDISSDDRTSVELIKNGFHPQETREIFQASGRYDLWEERDFYIDDTYMINDYVLIGKIFRFQGTYFTHSVMTCNNVPVTPGLLARYNVFLAALALLVEKDWEKVSSFTHVYDTFLSDLLSGSVTNLAIVEKRAGYVNFPCRGCFVLSNIPADPSGSRSLAVLGRELNSRSSQMRVTIYQGQVLAVHLLDAQFYETQYKKIRQELYEFCKEYGLTCGLSSRFSHLSELHAAYCQTLATLALAGRDNAECRLAPYCIEKSCFNLAGQIIYPYDDYYEYCSLDTREETLTASRGSVYFQALQRLFQYDQQHKINNMQLLRTYLAKERSVTATSVEMHMHRNNVAYRIKRIEELIGIDLEQPENRFRLLIAYALFNIKKDLFCGEESDRL